MNRAEAISKITTSLPRLSDEHLQVLAEITQSWSLGAAETPEDNATRAAIAKGIAQGRRGDEAARDRSLAGRDHFLDRTDAAFQIRIRFLGPIETCVGLYGLLVEAFDRFADLLGRLEQARRGRPVVRGHAGGIRRRGGQLRP